MRDLVTLSVRVFNDYLPGRIDAHFLYSQTPDNESTVIEAALQVKEKGITNNWLIMQTSAMSGINPETIKGVPTNSNMLHTLIESLAAVSFCKKMGYTSLIVSATPFHQLRAFMTAVTAAERLYPALKIYSLAGKAYPWNEQVIHSQGKTKGKRAILIDGEIDRIGIYGDKGDLLKVPEVLSYLNRRD